MEPQVPLFSTHCSPLRPPLSTHCSRLCLTNFIYLPLLVFSISVLLPPSPQGLAKTNFIGQGSHAGPGKAMNWTGSQMVPVKPE